MQRRLDGRTILAVDDDPDILAGMALALEAEAAKVIRAADGAQAWSALQAGGIDAVVLDMMLPQLSGLAILERLGTIEDRPPVVMVTANQGRRHREFATALGASAYFTKPVPLERLVDAVCESLR
ncbi:MAG: Transcriptional regulatory protein YycF [Planctomycetota bacterium]